MLYVVTGPESCGKSTLSRSLGERFGVPVIPEAARQLLGSTRYESSDLLAIARLQSEWEQIDYADFAIADTDLQVVYIWWQERFGPAPRELANAYTSQSIRHYLLCAPDLPWQQDPLRENPENREQLFKLYEADLRSRGLGYDVIRGVGEQRTLQAIACIESHGA